MHLRLGLAWKEANKQNPSDVMFILTSDFSIKFIA